MTRNAWPVRVVGTLDDSPPSDLVKIDPAAPRPLAPCANPQPPSRTTTYCRSCSNACRQQISAAQPTAAPQSLRERPRVVPFDSDPRSSNSSITSRFPLLPVPLLYLVTFCSPFISPFPRYELIDTVRRAKLRRLFSCQCITRRKTERERAVLDQNPSCRRGASSHSRQSLESFIMGVCDKIMQDEMQCYYRRQSGVAPPTSSAHTDADDDADAGPPTFLPRAPAPALHTSNLHLQLLTLALTAGQISPAWKRHSCLL
jgi:hypothetical protein